MNSLDLAALLPLLYFGFMGFRKGIIKQVFGLLGILLAIISTLHFSQLAVEQIAARQNQVSPLLPLIIYGLVFIGVFAVVILIGRVVEKMLKVAQLNIANRLAGMALGLAKAFLLLSAFMWLVDLANLFPPYIKEESLAYAYITHFTPALISFIGEIIPPLKELIANIESYFKEIAANIDRLN